MASKREFVILGSVYKTAKSVKDRVRAIKERLSFGVHITKGFDPRVNGQAHVHHAPPEFNAIVQGFSETTGIDIETIELRKVPSNGYELADKTIAMMFADYHEIHARLQVVSKEGHDIVTYRREVPV